MSVQVFRIEYEIIPSMNQWTTFIAGFTHEEAVKRLQQIVKKPIRITASGMQCRLDDLSTEVRQNVVNAFLGAKAGVIGTKKESEAPAEEGAASQEVEETERVKKGKKK